VVASADERRTSLRPIAEAAMLAAAARHAAGRAARLSCALAASILLALVGGCATITQGITQDIQVATDPIGAACELRQGDAVVDSLPWTPGYVRVRRSLDPYQVACRADGYLDATSALEPGVENGAVGSATMGALSGLQGTTGTTLTQAALATVMPAATAATYAAWLGVAGMVSMLVDIASGAVFEYPPGVAMTLVPSSFADAAARDRFFDGEDRRLRDQHASRRRELADGCRIACLGARDAIDRSLERELAELERLRASARVGG
jgi:hypothetical protein